MKKRYITPALSSRTADLHTEMLQTSWDISTTDGGDNEHGQYTDLSLSDTDDENFEIGSHQRGASNGETWGNIW